MEKIAPNEHYQDDEIDLYNLWLVLKKRKLIIFLIILVCLCTAVAYAILSPKVYLVSNTIILNQTQYKDEVGIIRPSELVAAVANLNEVLDLHKNKASQLLNIEVKDLSEIKSIKASEVKGSSTVRVDIETYDKNAGVALIEALPDYIQSVPVGIKLRMQKALMEKNRDDLKAIIDNPTKDLRLPSNTVVYVPSIDLYALHEKYNELDMAIDRMENKEIITLAWKTTPPLKPFKPNVNLSIFLGMFTGCFLGILVAFFIEWASNARRARGLGKVP